MPLARRWEGPWKDGVGAGSRGGLLNTLPRVPAPTRGFSFPDVPLLDSPIPSIQGAGRELVLPRKSQSHPTAPSRPGIKHPKMRDIPGVPPKHGGLIPVLTSLVVTHLPSTFLSQVGLGQGCRDSRALPGTGTWGQSHSKDTKLRTAPLLLPMAKEEEKPRCHETPTIIPLTQDVPSLGLGWH